MASRGEGRVAKAKPAETKPKRRKSAGNRDRAPSKKGRKKAPILAAPEAAPDDAPNEASAPRRRFRWLRRTIRYGIYALLAFLVGSVAWTAAYRYINPPVTPLMVLRGFQSDTRGFVIDKAWRDLDEMSPYAALCVLASEDQLFPDHNGFDLKALRSAIEDYQAGEPLRGASTISQQVAKNAFLWPSRSWARKGVEAYFTVLIELLWSKERILEVYLNIAETGDGMYGMESAAQVYFGKPASDLTLEEAALIATCLPNPRERDPRSPTPEMEERKAWILKQVRNLGGVRFLDRLEPEVAE